jgi:hypothetical protein
MTAQREGEGRLSEETRAIPRLVVTPRSLADYRDMFVLSDADLTDGSILDCAAGASPFGAQVRARGGSVVSVDPAYALAPDELVERVRQDIEGTYEWAATQHETLNWSYIGTPESMRRAFETATDLFALDYARHRDRYVRAELPNLPFRDRHFRLVLCSHLLFCYPQYLTLDEHVAALLELVRVCGDEVRVYPLVDTTATVYPHLDEVRAALATRGISSEVRPATAAWLAGGDRLLACRRA